MYLAETSAELVSTVGRVVTGHQNAPPRRVSRKALSYAYHSVVAALLINRRRVQAIAKTEPLGHWSFCRRNFDL